MRLLTHYPWGSWEWVHGQHKGVPALRAPVEQWKDISIVNLSTLASHSTVLSDICQYGITSLPSYLGYLYTCGTLICKSLCPNQGWGNNVEPMEMIKYHLPASINKHADQVRTCPYTSCFSSHFQHTCTRGNRLGQTQAARASDVFRAHNTTEKGHG